jgi:hypothetical protein
VLIASPDHWHALQAIEAARAGKDVYCEKPISVTIQEGRRVVETIRRYGRIFQTGTQYRSAPTIRAICQFVRDGGLGKVKQVFTQLHTLAGWLGSARCKPYLNVLNPEVTGKSFTPLDFALPAEAVPDGLDWDLWVGPAPWRPFNRLYHENPSPGSCPGFCDAFTSSMVLARWTSSSTPWGGGSGPTEIIHPRAGLPDPHDALRQWVLIYPGLGRFRTPAPCHRRAPGRNVRRCVCRRTRLDDLPHQRRPHRGRPGQPVR